MNWFDPTHIFLLYIYENDCFMEGPVLLGHGSGGQMTSDLVREVFQQNFTNPVLDMLADSGVVNVDESTLALTTDSYVIDPIFFPGGDIGWLAVCGTVNDLAVSAAKPLYMSAGFIIEEGFPIAQLREISRSMKMAAMKAGVQIIAGDTKVVKRGQCDKIFINTTGLGRIEKRHREISAGNKIKPGDILIVNGYLGDHEVAVLSAREQLQFEEPVLSDVAPLGTLIESVLQKNLDIRFMRDITRGGLATILSEIALSCHCGIDVKESAIPIREQVKGVCEIFGFDPLYLANEGKVLMIVARESAEQVVDLMRNSELGINACIIGSVAPDHPGRVVMHTITGSTRILTKLSGEQLPRIC
jgi:hydrogenase expression/formation protein HypE